MTPKQVYEGLTPDESPVMAGVRSGRVPYAQLRELVDHHAVRRILVSSDHFGLLPIDRGSARRRLKDSADRDRVSWFEERAGGSLEVSVTMQPVQNVKHPCYELWIHTIGVWKDDKVFQFPY